MVPHPGASSVAFVLLLGLASSALARQASEGPRLDVGASVAVRASSDARQGFSPRVTWNVTDQTALEGFADISHEVSTARGSGPARVVLFGQLKRRLMHTAVGNLFAVAGMHVSYWRRPSGGLSLTTPDGTTTFSNGSRTRHDWWSGVSIGGGHEVPIGRRLIVRADAQFGTTNDGPLVRTSIGAAVRLGWRERRPATPGTQAGVPRSRTAGHVVWVTMFDGRELKGRLTASGSGTLDLSQADGVTTIALAEIRQIESTDSLSDGARRGALVGGLGLGILAYRAFLNSSESDGAPVAGIMLGGIGAGLGALGGAMVDSFVEGRQVVYRAPARPTLTIAPLVSRQANGVIAHLAW